jgi:hypothetical protein
LLFARSLRKLLYLKKAPALSVGAFLSINFIGISLIATFYMKHTFAFLRNVRAAGLLLTLHLLLSGAATQAQTPAWQMVTTPSQASGSNASLITATATDANGNVYVVGNFLGTVSFGSTSLTSAGGSDAFVAKWNPATAAFAWAQRVGGVNLDAATAVTVAGANVYVAGHFSSSAASFGSQSLASAGGTDAFVTKLIDAGTTSSFAWTQRAGGTNDDQATGLARTGTNLYVAGSFGSATASFGTSSLSNSGAADAFVAKLTDAGASSSFVWAQPAGGTGVDGIWAIAANGADLYVAGYFNSAPASFGSTLLSSTGLGNYDGFVAKLTDQGTTGGFAWAQQGGGSGRDEARAIGVNGANVYVAGYFSGTATFGSSSLTSAGGYDVFVAKLTSTGSYTWAQQAGGTNDDQAQGLAVAGTTVYLAGAFNSPVARFGNIGLMNTSSTPASPTFDAFVTQLTDAGTAGAFGWAQRAGGPEDDYAAPVTVKSQQLYVAGSATPPASFGSLAINSPSGSPEPIGFLASLTDPTLTATTSALNGPAFTISPNPARSSTSTIVRLPAVPGAQATVTLTDAMGRVVRTTTLNLPAAGLRYELGLAGLPTGLYALQVQAGTATVTRRLVVE